jgi:hypothetical protein
MFNVINKNLNCQKGCMSVHFLTGSVFWCHKHALTDRYALNDICDLFLIGISTSSLFLVRLQLVESILFGGPALSKKEGWRILGMAST